MPTASVTSSAPNSGAAANTGNGLDLDLGGAARQLELGFEVELGVVGVSPLARHRGQEVEVLLADVEPADGALAGVEVLVAAPHREVDAVAKRVRTLG